MATRKQIEANTRNGSLGGVKTAKGKAISRYNAVKHGILAQEVLIREGDGAEEEREFQEILGNLQDEFRPHGALENLLIEKITANLWRLRRIYRYEAGLIRENLDNLEEKFYNRTNYDGKRKNLTDDEIDANIRAGKRTLKYCRAIAGVGKSPTRRREYREDLPISGFVEETGSKICQPKDEPTSSRQYFKRGSAETDRGTTEGTTCSG